jgi:peptidoglycan/LPS O-acetylase OafA/YrhL
MHQPRLSKSNYLPTLDGWRAVAILGVMICHACAAFFHPEGPCPNAFLRGLTRHGALGVDIFFGLSGFLICSRLLAEYRKNGSISLKKFYLRRCFRILPPYLTYLGGLGLLAAVGLVTISAQAWWSCLLFYRNYLPFSANGFYTYHFWSLSVEEHFYLLWPGLLILAGNRWARCWAAGLALAITAWRVWEFHHQWLGNLIPGVVFFGRTDIRLDGLLWGCWMALMLNDPIWRDRFTRWLIPGVWVGLAAAFIACVFCQPPLTMLWQSTLIPLLLAGTVLRPATVAGRVLELAPLRWIGRISYSLYLWNSLFFAGMSNPRPLPLGFLQTLPWSIFGVFACATLSYYFVEQPLIRWGHSLTSSSSLAEKESGKHRSAQAA